METGQNEEVPLGSVRIACPCKAVPIAGLALQRRLRLSCDWLTGNVLNCGQTLVPSLLLKGL